MIRKTVKTTLHLGQWKSNFHWFRYNSINKTFTNNDQNNHATKHMVNTNKDILQLHLIKYKRCPSEYFIRCGIQDDEIVLSLKEKSIDWRCSSISFLKSRNKTPSEFIDYALYVFILFFRIIFKKGIRKIIILLYQTKSRFYIYTRMELYTKVQTEQDVYKKKKCYRIHSRWKLW